MAEITSMEKRSLEELPRIFRGLDHPTKYYVYLILLKSDEPLAISEIQKKLKEHFNVDLAYSSVESLINSMQEAGIVEKITGRPKKVKLLKKITVSIESLE